MIQVIVAKPRGRRVPLLVINAWTGDSQPAIGAWCGSCPALQPPERMRCRCDLICSEKSSCYIYCIYAEQIFLYLYILFASTNRKTYRFYICPIYSPIMNVVLILGYLIKPFVIPLIGNKNSFLPSVYLRIQILGLL